MTLHNPASGIFALRALKSGAAILLGAITFMGLNTSSASAGFADKADDFLASYTGVKNGDLDVIEAEVTYDKVLDQFAFKGTMNAAIGTTTGVTYVFGLDRGQGTARFASLGLGNILFDSVVTLRTDGGSVRDLISGTETKALTASDIKISGNTISVVVSGAFLATKGFAKDKYTWNLWPRLAGGTDKLADFAPDNGVVVVRSVPEPMSLAMVGLGGVLISARRLRRRI